MPTAFFAYPESSGVLRDAISTACERSKNEALKLKPWQNMKIIGFKLDDLIRDQIREVDALAADITYPNHNVLYEIGYAIAVGKPVIPTVNVAIEGAAKRVQQVGIFDTTGWLTYENGEQLSISLRDWNDISWSNQYGRKRDHSQPLFILDSLKKTDFRNHIFHAVENSHVEYRKFDPEEVSRLTAAKAVAEVSASAGLIVPILGSDIVDAFHHNLRAAFLMGLAHGYGIDALAIQYENGPAPLDYRDFIRNSTFRRETEKHVEEYCADILIWNQKAGVKDRRTPPGILGQVSLGSSFAENETQSLSSYFIETAEYSRALRAEGAVIVGRKGAGKSAIFQQVSDWAIEERKACVVDLRPASHNLSEMREALLSVVQAGLFDHTIAAFWQYVMYLEIMLKIREMALPKAKYNYDLQERLRKVEEEFSLTEDIVSGDFTSRLDTAVRTVVRAIRQEPDAVNLRSQLTNIMFEQPIPKLRDSILSFHDQFDSILVLLDDLDKGWPPRRVEEHDVVIVKHLIEVLNRIHRDLGRKRMDMRHLMFLRSDIYERLVEQTSDRGKYNVIKVDWSDVHQLRHLLKERIFSGIPEEQHPAVWDAINPQIGNTDAVGMMVDHSLRRPRFLIDLCERVLSFAVNRGHEIVEEDDVSDGIRSMSLYLVSDFGYELRDVAGTPEDIFYRFIGSPELLTERELDVILEENELGLPISESIDLLLWYGFLGVVSGNTPVFIYDRGYDFRRLQAERPSDSSEILYAVNPAFIVGLAKDQAS